MRITSTLQLLHHETTLLTKDWDWFLFSSRSLHIECLQIDGDGTGFCKSDISDKFDIWHEKIISDKMMFCWNSWISQELESVIYSFLCRSR